VAKYELLPEDYLNRIGPTGRYLIDLSCLSDHNSRENEKIERDRKEREYKNKYPGCTRYEGEDKWATLDRAKAEEIRLKELNR